MIRCPNCGRFVKSTTLGKNDIGTCKHCNAEITIHAWHYIDESGDAVCGYTVKNMISLSDTENNGFKKYIGNEKTFEGDY